MAQGRTDDEIATELYISTSTVKAHLAGLLRKLGARNRRFGLRYPHSESRGHVGPVGLEPTTRGLRGPGIAVGTCRLGCVYAVQDGCPCRLVSVGVWSTRTQKAARWLPPGSVPNVFMGWASGRLVARGLGGELVRRGRL